MTCFYKLPNRKFYEQTRVLKETEIDVIGNLKGSQSEVDNEDTTYSKEYHVNTIWPVPEWEEYRIYPNTPMRIIG